MLVQCLQCQLDGGVELRVVAAAQSCGAIVISTSGSTPRLSTAKPAPSRGLRLRHQDPINERVLQVNAELPPQVRVPTTVAMP